MSSIIIAGDTSGSVTLQAPAVSGSTVLNLPATSGTIQASGAGYTTNGVAYATSATGLTTGSALTFDGSSLVLGGTERINGTTTSALTIASTVVSIYSICQIFATTKQLSATNQKVRLNSKTLEIHSALLVLSCFASVCYPAHTYFPLRIAVITGFIVVIVDLLIQLFICYICVKLGFLDSLNRFDCCLVDDGNGGYQIKFILKKNMPEAIGVLHASKEVTE